MAINIAGSKKCLLTLILAVCTLFGQGQLGQAAVQFKFNASNVFIAESGNLSSHLSILKTGNNSMNISFSVTVTPGTAVEGQDYVANANFVYTFTSRTSELSIVTRLEQDRAGESIESFTICLPDPSAFQTMGTDTVEVVDPRCTTVTIIDDDSVVIGFADSSVMVTEGASQSVCAEVQSIGLQLDPFDNVPLSINADNGNLVQLSSTSLVFGMGTTSACVTVSTIDNNVADGSRNASLTLTASGPAQSTVPVELFPNTITVMILDNDRVTFNIIPQTTVILEGDTINTIMVQRLGDTTLEFMINLMVTPISPSSSSSDIIVTDVISFNPSQSKMTIQVEVPENALHEMQAKVFTVSLAAIRAVNARIDEAMISTGDPVKITVYDNDFQVGFTRGSIALPEDEKEEVCIEIVSPRDIYPNTSIPLTSTAKNLTVVEGNLEPDVKGVTLNATEPMCFNVELSNNNDMCDSDNDRRFVLQLSLNMTNPRYNVTIVQENTTITIDDSQDCRSTSSAVGIAVGITFGISVIIIIIVVVVLLIVVLVFKPRCSNDYTDKTGQVDETIPIDEVTEEVALSESENTKDEEKHDRPVSGGDLWHSKPAFQADYKIANNDTNSTITEQGISSDASSAETHQEPSPGESKQEVENQAHVHHEDMPPQENYSQSQLTSQAEQFLKESYLRMQNGTNQSSEYTSENETEHFHDSERDENGEAIQSYYSYYENLVNDDLV